MKVFIFTFIKVLTYGYNFKATPKFLVADATERKKDCMQFPCLEKKTPNPLTMEEVFDDDRQQCTPFMPTCTPIVHGF